MKTQQEIQQLLYTNRTRGTTFSETSLLVNWTILHMQFVIIGKVSR